MSAFTKIETFFESANGLATSFYATDDQAIRLSALELPQILLPASLEKTVAKRQNEFRIGRLAAYAALAKLGAKSISVLEHVPHSAPNWPEGFSGSITHTSGLIGAAVVMTDVYKSVGLDAESFMSKTTAQKVISQILTENEIRLLSGAASELGLDEGKYLTAAFSAKEAIYKAHSKIFPDRRSFQDVEVKLSRTDLQYRWKNESTWHPALTKWTKTHIVTLVTVQ